MTELYWNIARCKARAKDFTHRSEWAAGCVSSYQSAADHGWLDQCCSHMMRPKKWTKKAVLKSAQSCRSRTEWRRRFRSAYDIAQRGGYIDEACLHMGRAKTAKKWTRKKLTEDADQYESLAAWRRGSESAYVTARRMGLLTDIARRIFD